MNKLYILLVFIALITYSCEETVTGVDLLYEEQIVIHGFIEAGKTIDEIVITRTFSPLDEISFEESVITDAEAVIIHNGKEYPLYYNLSYSYSSPELIPIPGEKYKIEVKWKNMTATAETEIKDMSQIEIIDLEWEHVTIKNEYENTSYWVPLVVLDHLNKGIYDIGILSKYYEGREGFDPVNIINDNQKEKFQLIQFYYPNADTNMIKQQILEQEINFILYKYDDPYWDYYQTKWEGESPGGIFGGSGQNIHGNVKGDGIGIFIGRNKLIKPVKKLMED